MAPIDDVPVPTEPPRAPTYQTLAFIAAPWVAGVVLWFFGGWPLVLFAIVLVLLIAGLVCR